MQWVRCRVAEISVRHGEYGERIGKGKVVDLDRVVSHAKGAQGERVPVTLGDLVKGREECFEPAEGPQTAQPVAAPTPLDVDEE